MHFKFSNQVIFTPMLDVDRENMFTLIANRSEIQFKSDLHMAKHRHSGAISIFGILKFPSYII